MTKAIPYVPYVGVVVTRAEAKAAGLRRYFTGNPCMHGHVAQRWTASGSCQFCGNALTAAYHKATKEEPQRVRERQRRWAKENRHKDWAYYEKNAETIKARRRQRYVDDPGKFKVAARNRAAQKAGAEGSYTIAEVLALLEKQRGKCAYCREPVRKRYHVDHIVPLADGGSNWISNLQVTCPTCNMRKGRMDATLFAVRLGRLL